MTEFLSSKLNLMGFDNTLRIFRPTIGDSFYVPKRGHEFAINRPAFRAETKTINEPTVPLGEPFTLKGIDRRGIGNYEIERQNFLADDPRPRQLFDLEVSPEEKAKEITLSEKTLNQMFRTKVEDASDIEWLNEKARLLAAGYTEAQLKIMKPLGREQRQIYRNINLAEASKNVESKMNVIEQALIQGRLETKADIQAVSQDITKLLGDFGQMNKLTNGELIKLKQVIDRLGTPKDLKSAGFSQRLYDRIQYNPMAGVINAYIISKTPMADLQQPLTVIRTGKPIAKWSLASISNWSGVNSTKAGENPNFPSLYLDLENATIISQDQAFALVNSGVDNGVISGKPLPANIAGVVIHPPPPPPLLRIGERPGDVARVGPQNPPAMISDFDIDSLTPVQLMKYGRALSRYHNFKNIREYVMTKYSLDNNQTDALLGDVNLLRAEVKALNYIE